MALSVIPIVGIVAMMIFSSPDHDKSKPVRPSKPSLSKSVMSKSPPKNLTKEEKLDYETIHSYIKSVYKGVSDEDADEIAKSLVDYGKENGIDPKLAAALIARESSFNKHAVSPTGAKGLGQIKDFNYKDLKIADPHNIKQNVSGTTKYLKTMLSQWKDKSDEQTQLALASYFRGYTNIKNQKNNTGKIDPTAQAYVDDILKNYESLKQRQLQ